MSQFATIPEIFEEIRAGRTRSANNVTVPDNAISVGFHEAARWPMEYLHQRLYAWLDPGLSPVLGACGFTVYVRDRAR